MRKKWFKKTKQKKKGKWRTDKKTFLIPAHDNLSSGLGTSLELYFAIGFSWSQFQPS
jgi:hypothetical protein